MSTLNARRFTSAVVACCILAQTGCSRSKQATEPASVKVKPVAYHPVFRTPVTGTSLMRPAIQVEILDARENGLLRTTAELYLTVQSSRFPAETWVVLPINVGEFAGCRVRFIQLPFEVEPRDNLVFNLLDEDDLSDADVTALLGACRATGYCVSIAGKVYCPQASSFISPAAHAASEILGDVVVADASQHKFENYGVAEFIVPSSLPTEPQEANRLSLVDSSNYSRMVIKLYSPPNPLDFTIDAKVY